MGYRILRAKTGRRTYHVVPGTGARDAALCGRKPPPAGWLLDDSAFAVTCALCAAKANARATS